MGPDVRPSPRPRVAVVASHPIQHFCPLYRALTADGRLDLKVFFASDAGKRVYYDPAFGREITWGSDVTEGFEHEFLPGADTRDVTENAASPRLGERLEAFSPDVVQVYGYSRVVSRQALYWARRRRVRSLMVADSELLTPRSAAQRAVKAVYVRALLRLPTGFLTIGDENERYYRHYGVSQRRLHRSPIPIDSELMNRVLAEREQVRQGVRNSWEVGEGDVVSLTVGKSVPHKAHPHVVRAVGLLPAPCRDRTVAVFAGGGPDTPLIRAEAERLGVRVVTPGFLSVTELMAAYVGADLVVHPSSTDPHPLAVAEAVYAGLPVLVSDRIGSWGPSDDVRPGRNGLRYPFGDVAALAEALTALVQDPDHRARLGAASRDIGRHRTLSASVDTYVQAVLSS
ncbi:glycosyltransferase family 4 protein [Geodermatophilus sp. CPCC 205506]|uniref:glycosyltransferase family 4 protein n=1 Tax=Geodermatophilus sp. CPCC 205506 TaxID=2936596 RepID=UPI003EEAF235